MLIMDQPEYQDSIPRKRSVVKRGFLLDVRLHYPPAPVLLKLVKKI